MMWAWLLLLTVVLWVAVFRFRRRRMYELASCLPGPGKDELPLVGIALSLLGDTEVGMERVKSYSYRANDNNGLLRSWCGPWLLFVKTNPVDLEYVLKTCLDKSHMHRFTRNILGNGTLLAPVPIWRHRRKILVPSFSPKIVDTFVEVFVRQSEKLVSLLSQFADAGGFSMWPFLSTYTLDGVCETTMGVNLNSQENPNTIFLVSMNKILNLVAERYFKIWLQPDWLYNFFPQSKDHAACLNKMHNFTDEVIQKKREEFKSDSSDRAESDTQYDLPNYKSKTFLDHLIKVSASKNEQGYSDLELREEMMTLTIAGTDTSAVAMGFTMVLLAKYPQIQEKVYQEIYEIFGDSNRPLVKDDLANLKYLERVLKESLRLFPPAPMILRMISEDTTLPSGRVLPAGGVVLVSLFGVHRDPKYWGPDAEHFDPDRFLPERFNLAHSCSFMPFSQGPRNCVGYQYALMSIKTALSAILRKYRIVGEPETSPIPKIRMKLDLMMKAIDGYKVALETRKPMSSV